MANRFPLALDGTAIKELPSGDNLDLTGSGITGVGTVALNNLTVGGSQGTDGQVLTSTGSGIAWEDAASGGGGGAWNVISSTTLSSAVANVQFTLSGYENYAIKFTNLKAINAGFNYTTIRFYFSTDNGSSWSSNVQSTRRRMGSYNNTGETYHGRDNQIGDSYLNVVDHYSNNSGSGIEHNAEGVVYINNNKSGSSLKSGTFYGLVGRTYSNASNVFTGDGFYTVNETNVLNKVKIALDGNASVNLPAGTFTLYGIANS